MTLLLQKMLDELQRRNYSQNTINTYLHAVEDFSRYFHRSPGRLGPDHIRQYQAYLFRERKLQAGTLHCAPQLCAFSTSRRCDGRICPSTSHFPSAQGNYPSYSVQKRFSG